jgi:hypothetical protein
MNETAIRDLQDATAWDADGTKLGSVANVLLDARTGQPEWITVPLGLFDTRARFIPLAGSRRDGTDLFVAYSQDTISKSPHFDAEGNLTDEQQAELRDYYGLS